MENKDKNKQISVDNNPWAGLSSYEDPAKVEREGRTPKLFCGRDDESHSVAQLITGNIFVTLYGKSGTGKTSLLNAGVFPHLRQKRYLPVNIRLSMDAMEISFQQCIIKQIFQALILAGGQQQTIDVVPLPTDKQQPDYLWAFFARTRFLDAEGRTLFPVIVLDQFEEVFRNRHTDAGTLLRQIAYLMDESHALAPRMVDRQPYNYDFNFRFVVSIREDDLYRLEDSIDNNYLSELKHCRYRLRSLSEKGAEAAILIPGEGLFKEEEQKGIVKTIIEIARNKEDKSINTNVLSLICSRIFVDFQKSDTDFITPSLVDTFIKGNPFERFYNEATRGFSKHEKIFIEDHLVDSTGRRSSVSEDDFLFHVKNGKKLLEGNTRILQRISTSSGGGNFHIELIHDSFCEVLTAQKYKRKKKKTLIQRFFLNGIFDCIVLSVDVFLFLIFFVTQKEYSSLLLALITAPLLIFSTYMINVTRIHNDRHIEAFLLPQIATSFAFWAYTTHHEMYAYYSLKPHDIELLIQCFFFLNIALFCLGLYNYFFINYYDKKLIWKDFISIRIRENRYAQFSILLSVIVALVILFYYGSEGTYYEVLRNKEQKSIKDLIELGDYYMSYDMDDEKAKPYYQRAKALGSTVAIQKLENLNLVAQQEEAKEREIYLTEQMKLEIISAMLYHKAKGSAYLVSPQQKTDSIATVLATCIIDTNKIDKECINNIIEYYERIDKNDSAVMRWKYIRARLFDKWGNFGYQFLQGEYATQDKKRAFEIYLRHKSHNNVVNCYLYGWGVEKDINKAIEYARENKCALPSSTRFYLKFYQLISNMFE